MNNKQLGTEFEQEAVKFLNKTGAWVHFISPDNSGAQPFDIIAVKDGVALAIDCKTSKKRIFPITRLEQNQIMAFDKWLACGNADPVIFVKYCGEIKIVSYTELKAKRRIDLNAV